MKTATERINSILQENTFSVKKVSLSSYPNLDQTLLHLVIKKSSQKDARIYFFNSVSSSLYFSFFGKLSNALNCPKDSTHIE